MESVEDYVSFVREQIEQAKVNCKYPVFNIHTEIYNGSAYCYVRDLAEKTGENIKWDEGIDSANSVGKLMITILGAVAEIERENISVHTLEGRKQKARDGGWNGGQAPYGYKLENHMLVIDEEEAEIVRIIFDEYVHTNIGAHGIATHLENRGITKKIRNNSKLDLFSASHIKWILDNEVYCGKIAYGKRKSKPSKTDEGKMVKEYQKDYIVCEGKHEAIVSEEIWNLAHEKRLKTGVRHEKTYNLEHEHILSGILKCPVCGASLYGNISGQKSNGSRYYYYSCKRRNNMDGHRCNYRKQWREERVDSAVVEIIKKLVHNNKFADAIKSKIDSKINTDDIDKELSSYEEQLSKHLKIKKQIANQIDNLDPEDDTYDEEFADLHERLKEIYRKIKSLREQVEETKNKKNNILKQKIDVDNVYKYLLYFDKFYDKFTDGEKKQFFKSFVDRIDLYETEQENGQFLKHIKFKFPVFHNGQEVEDIFWDKDKHVETVCLLTKK